MTLNAVRLDLPETADPYVFRGNLRVTEQHTPEFLFNGFNKLIAASKEATGQAGSIYAQAFEGSGTAKRSWTISADQWQGSTDSFGPAAPGDSVATKLQTLAADLAETRITSTRPATFQFGEYSESGAYSPITVVFGRVELPAELGERPSAFTADIEVIEALDLRTDVQE